MRIKSKTTFIHDGSVVTPGHEVDVPESIGMYLIDLGLAEQVSGGKGVKEEITVDTSDIQAKAAEAAKALKAPTKEPKKRTQAK